MIPGATWCECLVELLDARGHDVAGAIDGVVKLVDQGGFCIVRQVKVWHALDMGSLTASMNLSSGTEW